MLSILLALALCIGLVACASESPTDNSTNSPAADSTTAAPAVPAEDDAFDYSKVTIASILHTEDQGMNLYQTGIRAACEEVGAKVVTNVHGADIAKMVELCETYKTAGVDGILIAPSGDEDAIDYFSKFSRETGIPFGLINSVSIDLEKWDNFVINQTSPNYQMGYGPAQDAIQLIKEKLDGQPLKIALMLIREGSKYTYARSDGFLEALDEAGIEYEVVATSYTMEQDVALQYMMDMLVANPDINIVYAAGEAGTIGAAAGVRAAGYQDKAWVFGCDLSDQIVSDLENEDGVMQSVAAQSHYEAGLRAGRQMLKAIAGEDISDTYGKEEPLGVYAVSRSHPEYITMYQEWWKMIE